jgi:hypothetical protein
MFNTNWKVLVSIKKTQANSVFFILAGNFAFFLILTGNIPVRFKTIIQTFFSILTGKFPVRIDKTELLISTSTSTYLLISSNIIFLLYLPSGWSKRYSHLSNKHGGWNKRGGCAKVAKPIIVEVGILQLESSTFLFK